MIDSISDKEIESARQVLYNFVVEKKTLSHQSALESGLFAIVNQASPWETASKITHAWRYYGNQHLTYPLASYASIELLLDIDKVNKIAHENGWRFPHEPRFKDLISKWGNSQESWWYGVINADSDTRNEIVKEVNYLSNKTTSFWHLCLGGTNLLPIDIHVRRQLKALGVDVPQELCEHKPRFKTKDLKIKSDNSHPSLSFYSEIDYTPRKTKREIVQYVANEPTKKQYEDIEEKARDFFSQDERFIVSGKVDLALVAGVLWWRGANRNNPHKRDLFYEGHGDIWKLPYGDLSRFRI